MNRHLLPDFPVLLILMPHISPDNFFVHINPIDKVFPGAKMVAPQRFPSVLGSIVKQQAGVQTGDICTTMLSVVDAVSLFPLPDSRVLLSVLLNSNKTGSCVVLVMVSTGLNWMRT
ncbi:hypothetical protein ETR_14321 [Erwinia tracheiphila PSU-1]|nr:hypothetical protein ETR_14321 [Erwinia tracheiphila PSU-1]